MSTDQITSFGRYIIESLIGVGGSGRVYRAFDPERNRIVALKVLNTSEADDDTISKIRFRREFQAASQLNHPHLVKVFDTGSFEGREFFTMEFIDGEDLDHHLTSYDTRFENAPDLNQADRVAHFLDILIQMADSLSYLHGFMYVHRDLKPANVLLTRDSIVKLTDFGLMKQQGSSQMTRTGAILGTVEYMSPEQTVTARVDARSDLYSFGVIAFKLFTGVLPFSGGLMRQLVARTREEAPDPRIYNPKLDTQICHFIMKLLKRRPEDRYGSARETWDSLIRIRESIFGQNSSSSSITHAIEPVSIIVNDPACLGRDTAISDMRRHLEILRHGGKGSLILIQGEAGIGKTRLINEIQTLAAFHSILFHRGTSSQSGSDGLQPWIEVIRGFYPLVSAYPTDDCSKLLSGLDPIMDSIERSGITADAQPAADGTKYQFFDLASRFLVQTSQITPMILHLENAHFASPDTIEFLQFIARRAVFPGDSGSSIDQLGKFMILVSFQPDAIVAGHPLGKIDRLFGKQDRFRSIRLERFTIEQTGQMVQGILSGEIAVPDFTSRIHRIAHGNPLCVMSLVRHLVASGDIKRRGVVWIERASEDVVDSFDFNVPPLPDPILSSVTSYLEALGERDLHFARSASVLGMKVPFEDLVAVASVREEDALDCLDRLLSRGIMKEDPQHEECFEFVSPFAMRVLYESMPKELRQNLHRTALHHSMNSHSPHRSQMADLAHHAIHSNDPLMGTVGLDAAKELVLAGAIPTATEIAQKTWPVLPEASPRYFEARSLFARCLFIMNRFGSAKEQHQAILDVLENLDPSHRGADCLRAESEARSGLADIEAALGNIDDAIAQISPLIARLSEFDSDVRIDLMQTSALFSMYKGNLDTADELLRSAFDMAEQLGDKRRLARAHHLTGMLHFYRSDYNRSGDSHRTALALRTELNDVLGIAQIKSNLGILEKMQDCLEDAATMFRDAALVAERACDVSNWALYLQNLASIQLKLGAIDQSVSSYRRALAIFEEFRMLPRIAMCLNNLGGALWDSQKLSESLTMFVRALSIYEQLGHLLAQAACLGNISVTLIELDQLDLAQEYLDRARRIYTQIGPSPGITESEIHMARLHTRMGQFTEAETVLSAVDMSINLGKMTAGLYHFAIGELGVASSRETMMERSTIEHLDLAVSIFKEIRKHGFAQIASMKLGRHLVVSGIDPDRGEMILDELRQQS